MKLRNILFCAALLLATGCSWRHVLQRGDDGLYRITGRDYWIAPLQDGAFMPPGWHAREVVSGYGQFNKLEERDLDFGRDADDGVLLFITWPITNRKTVHPIRALAHEAAAASVPHGRSDTLAMNEGSARELNGGEAWELSIALTKAGSVEPALKFYFFVFRKAGSDDVTLLRYGDAPVTFSAAMDDVAALTHRISFVKAASP